MFELITNCMYPLLVFLYNYMSPSETKSLILVITVFLGVYLLRPLYYAFRNKGKEKVQLTQLQRSLLENITTKDDNSCTIDQFENMAPKPLPPIIKEIALITSQNGAGLNDFKEVLHCGHYTLYPTVMREDQPEQLISGIITHIESINQSRTADIICITRGGGSELADIFSSMKLAFAIKGSSIPVLIGIGHATDRLLCDKVSDSPILYGRKRYFITTTDLAYFLNQYNENQINDTTNKLQKLGHVTEHINWGPVIIYFVILYALNKSLFHFIK